MAATPTTTMPADMDDASAAGGGAPHSPMLVDATASAASAIVVPNDLLTCSSRCALEELSPTTDEYQECCAPEDFPMNADDDESDAVEQPSDVAGVADSAGRVTDDDKPDGNEDDDGGAADDDEETGEQLAPGCVAPAPTPAPSIAPLAEIEGADGDDEPDESFDVDDVGGDGGDGGDDRRVTGCVANVVVRPTSSASSTTSSSRHVNRKTRTRSADVRGGGRSGNVGGVDGGAVDAGGIPLEARPGASVSRQQSVDAEAAATATVAASAAGTPNPVCPWDDE